jgi:hypothetical protein
MKIFVIVFSRIFFFYFSRKKLGKIFHSECRSGSRGQLTVVYPDPKHCWMLPKNHLKKFRFWWKASRTQKYLQKHEQKLKFFAKSFAKTKIFMRQNLAKSERIFAYFRFSRKWKRGYRFNSTYILSLAYKQLNLLTTLQKIIWRARPKIRAPYSHWMGWGFWPAAIVYVQFCYRMSLWDPHTHTASRYFLLPELSNTVPYSVKSRLQHCKCNCNTALAHLYKTLKLKFYKFYNPQRNTRKFAVTGMQWNRKTPS